MDTFGCLCCEHHGVARITILAPTRGQPPGSVLSYHVAGLWTYDNEDYPGASYSPTLPVLDSHAGAHDRRRTAGKPSLLHHSGNDLRTSVCELRAVVPTLLLRLCGSGVWTLGAFGHHQHLRLPGHQLSNDSQSDH
jgi:hypothetical protein